MLLASVAAAQTTTPAAELYVVELVVFEQPQGTSVELPPGDEEYRLDFLAGPSAEPVSGDQGSVLPRGVSGPRSARQLDAVARRLNSGGYRLLWHQSWIQPAGNARGLPLSTLAALGGGPAQPALTGSVSLTAGRFLHLGVDLELSSAEGLAARLKDRRRVRINEQHYLDNPQIGVIALVTRVGRAGD